MNFRRSDHPKAIGTRRIRFVREDGTTEGMWATPLKESIYRIENVPFFVFGISYHDLVEASRRQGALTFVRVVGRGGHSTYRMFVQQPSRFAESWAALQGLGCSFEKCGERLVAVDVPNDARIHEVYARLEDGESSGVWEFEEGHCGHDL